MSIILTVFLRVSLRVGGCYEKCHNAFLIQSKQDVQAQYLMRKIWVVGGTSNIFRQAEQIAKYKLLSTQCIPNTLIK